MANDAERRGREESPLDRMMRFGEALFAVPKDELPKRAECPKRKSSRKNPKPAAGT